MSGHFAMLMDLRHSLNTLLRNVVGEAHGPVLSPLEADEDEDDEGDEPTARDRLRFSHGRRRRQALLIKR